MPLLKRFCSLIAILLLASNGYVVAQTVNQFNSWWTYSGNHKLTEKIGLHTEYQFRRNNFIDEWQQSLMRVGVDYYLPNKASVTAGYGWIVSYPYGEQPINATFTEHRIWQQFILQEQLGRFYFHHRFRLEQRFLENVASNNGVVSSDGYRFRQRGRYRFLVTVPLTKKTLEDNTLFLAAYDEPFLGFGKGIKTNILDQNRAYIGLGWRFNKNVNVQLGYLNHRVNKSDGLHIENNHTLVVGLTYNIDFTELKSNKVVNKN